MLKEKTTQLENITKLQIKEIQKLNSDRENLLDKANSFNGMSIMNEVLGEKSSLMMIFQAM